MTQQKSHARTIRATSNGVILAVAFALSGCVTTPPPTGSQYLTGFVDAEASGTTFPPATEVIPDLDMKGAYDLQKRIVLAKQAKGDLIAGYKGGLMSAKSLSDRKVTEPLVGVLFASGQVANHGQVALCGYRRAAFEAKLGYIFGSAVNSRVATIDELKSHVSHVQPVVDLPDIAYRDDKTYGAIDMTAANISAASFVRGAVHPRDQTDLDDLTVSMSRDGAPLTRGAGRESLGAQWESLRTVVNLIVEHGGEVRPGQVIITGKIGDKGDLPKGVYRGDYGSLGEVTFKVVDCPAR